MGKKGQGIGTFGAGPPPAELGPPIDIGIGTIQEVLAIEAVNKAYTFLVNKVYTFLVNKVYTFLVNKACTFSVSPYLSIHVVFPILGHKKGILKKKVLAYGKIKKIPYGYYKKIT
jgi:hypothetical protein